MHESDDSTVCRAKVQRSQTGAVLGACLAVGAEDISFVGSDTEWLMVQKKKAENGLTIEIRGEAP